MTVERIATQQNYPLLTAILSWCGLIVVSSLYVTVPLLGVFAEAFAVSQEQASWTSSVFSFWYAIGFLFFGALTERFGRRNVMMVGLLLLTIVTLVIGLVETFYWLIFLRALQGFVAASFAPAALAYVVEIFPNERRATTIGFLSTGFLMAGIVGQFISSLIVQYSAWNHVFTILAGLYCMSFFLLIKLPKDPVPDKAASFLALYKSVGMLFTQKPLLCCYAITFTLLLSFVGMYTVLGNYLGDSFGMTDRQILFVRTIGIFGMLLSPLAGYLIRKFHHHTVLRAGLAFAVLGLAFMGIAPYVGFLVAMSVLFVAGVSLTIPTMIVLIGQLGGDNKDLAISLYTFILFIGATLGPMIGVRVLQSSGYLVAFGTFAMLLSISLFLSFWFKREDLGSSQ